MYDPCVEQNIYLFSQSNPFDHPNIFREQARSYNTASKFIPA
jgi:hypothetical protein